MFLTRYLARISGASVSPILEFSCRFARTVILSHLLAPHDVGVVIALVTIYSGFELVTDVGLGQFVIIQARQNPAQSVAVVQRIGIARGILLAVIIVALAPWLATLFGASGHAASIRWLGAVPLIRCLQNWRIVQIQSEYKYGPQAIANIAAQIGAIIAVVVAALRFQDERAILASLIVEAALYAALSRLLLPRERISTVDPAVRRAALAYGLPLMANGVGLLIVAQLDRVIVANLFDLATLALYSLTLNLVLVSLSPLGQVANSLGLPFLGRWRGDPAESRQAALIVFLGMLVAASVYAVGVGLFLDLVVPLIYGPHYVVTPAFQALAAVVAFLRFCRIAVNLVLLTHSRTKLLTVGNLAAIFGLISGFLLATWTGRVEAVLFGVLIGDLISLIVLSAFASRHFPMGAALAHSGLLAVPVGLAALGSLEAGGAGFGARSLMLTVALVVIGLDSAIVYRRHLPGFLGVRRRR
jgi:O-antigen/teichoic acid export membrane protein